VVRLPETPDGWELLEVRRFGPFVVGATYRGPSGAEQGWSSRRHRTHTARGVPTRVWWTAGLFSVGSFGFALGSFPPYLRTVSPLVDNLTYFGGSVCFTLAALLCVVGAVEASERLGSHPASLAGRLLRVDSIGWWSAIVQFAGTIWFNVMTLRAVVVSGSAAQVDALVWRPDLLGSACFLVSSYLAVEEARRQPADVPGRAWSWWVVALNLLGSIAFGVSAVASFTRLSTQQILDFRLDDAGTFVGALCFLVAAVLTVPEARCEESNEHVGGRA